MGYVSIVTGRQRIAKGSGTSVNEVNRVMKSYTMMLKMMKIIQLYFLLKELILTLIIMC